MAAPFSALGRIIQPYVVDGLTHECKIYVRNPQAVGSSYNINSRALDENDLPWEDASNGLAEAISYLLPSIATPGTAILEVKSGVSFIPVSSNTTTLAHIAGSYEPAGQWTLTLRDVLFYEVKVQLMEAAAGAPFRTVGLYPTTSGWKSCQLQFTKDYTVSAAPWYWMVGRSNQYLRPDPIIAATATLNRKLRRARGFA